jgi:hypothetical protein
MTEPTPTPTPTPAPTPTPIPAPPWYEGKADADILGHWDNKGWKRDDPATIAIEATKAAREAQRFVGAPTDRLIRLPEKADDEAGWNSVWQRLGVPKDAKEYDFAAVKFTDGTELDAAFTDMIRNTAITNHIPKDAATALARDVVKFMEGADANEAAERAAKLTAERAELAKSWGKNADMNKLQAMQGAKRLGVDEATVASLENVVGYAKIMEMFRKIGAGTSEETFIEGGGSGNPATVQGAQARLDELKADQAWGKRLLAGDSAAKREFENLTQLIASAA